MKHKIPVDTTRRRCAESCHEFTCSCCSNWRDLIYRLVFGLLLLITDLTLQASSSHAAAATVLHRYGRGLKVFARLLARYRYDLGTLTWGQIIYYSLIGIQPSWRLSNVCLHFESQMFSEIRSSSNCFNYALFTCKSYVFCLTQHTLVFTCKPGILLNK